MCVAVLGGAWWIFPLIGFVMCLGFLVMALRFARTGRGCLAMCGHRDRADEVAKTDAGVVKPAAS